MITQEVPEEWQYCIDSVYYKVCKKWGYVWYWVNDHWQRSSKTEAELGKKSKVESKRTYTPAGRVYKRTIVLNAITKNGAMSKQDVVVVTGVKFRTVEAELKNLREEGRLELSKDGLWSVPMVWRINTLNG